jgi:lipoprotein-anchoring transpeptidase ErfK/SrfK
MPSSVARRRWLPLLGLAALACSGDPSGPTARPPSTPTTTPATSSPTRPPTAPEDAGTVETSVAAVDAAADVVDAAPPPPRIGSVSHYTWVYKRPNRNAQPIGYVRPGTEVDLQSTEAVAGSGCRSGRWMSIKPTGFVCNDATTTLDLDTPLYQALADVVRGRDDVLPYRYAYSTGAPMYGRIPTEEEIVKAERGFFPVDQLPRDGKPRTTYEELAAFDVLAGRDPLPSFASPELPRMRGYATGLVRKTIPSGSLLSFNRAIEGNGRTYLLSTDLTLVPADRVRPFRETKFHGVAIGGEVQLPIAWTRSVARNKYRKLADGSFEVTSDTWPPRTVLGLTGRRETHKGRAYLETREAGVFIREVDASVVEATTTLPSSVREDDKWIEFSARKGTFTLYEGRKAVYSTLASPGRGGGAPSSRMSVEELVDKAYTPLGIYRVTFKTRATTMTPEGSPNPKKHWIQDVPYTQYFRRPFAIHTAYWHEDFGMPKSGGCINLAPVDARYVFGWTDPPMPAQWSGVSSSKEMGLGTTVVLRR